jgi:hypothetical protein
VLAPVPVHEASSVLGLGLGLVPPFTLLAVSSFGSFEDTP